MKILYHLTILPPPMPECEAISQEINALRSRFGGDIVYLNPNQRSPIYVPRALFGFHKLGHLRGLEKDLHLHHLYNPDPFPFPVLRFLRRPVIYSLTGGVEERPNLSFFGSLAAVTVADKKTLKRLESWGLDNVTVIHPGIDTSRFTINPLPLQSDIRLMVGSAPWTSAQFETKGVDALLAAAQQSRRLHLVFLWRGVLGKEMRRRLRKMNLGKQVTMLNEQVEVNHVLAKVHASIALATAPDIVKAYPHSLLESLAAGKPILVSRAIPMADYVVQTGCGTVVDNVSPADVLSAVEALASEYDGLRESAQSVGRLDFTQERHIESVKTVYERVHRSQ